MYTLGLTLLFIAYTFLVYYVGCYVGFYGASKQYDELITRMLLKIAQERVSSLYPEKPDDSE